MDVARDVDQLSSLDQVGQEVTSILGKLNAVLLQKSEFPEEVSAIRIKMKLLMNMLRRLEEIKHGSFRFRLNQLTALKDIRDFLGAPEEELKGLIQQPTGAGKTATFGLLTWLFDVETLILVPNKNLLHQTKYELQDLFGFTAEEIGLVGDGHLDVGRKVTIATYSSHIARHKRGGRYAKFTASIPFVICDEAHTALGDRTQDAISKVTGEDALIFDEGESDAEHAFLESEVFHSRHALLLGFTATPKLRTKRAVDYFGRLVSRVRMSELMKAGILKKLRSHFVPGQLSPEEEDSYISLEKETEILEREDVYRKLLHQLVTFRDVHAGKLRTAAYCANNIECEKLAKIAETEFGLRSIIITAKIGADRLEEAESKLLSGEIDLVITVEKLATGWNFPPLNSIILARATNSPVRIIQPVGRASRSYKGEEYAHVFETHWQVRASSNEGNGGNDVKEPSTSGDQNSFESNSALLLAQAFAEIGEDPHDLIEGLPEGMQFNISIYLDEEGYAQHPTEGGILELVSLKWIASKMLISDDHARTRLQNANILPAGGFSGRTNGVGPRYPVYPLSDVRSSLESELTTKLVELDQNGRREVDINGRKVTLTSIQGFADTSKRSFSGVWGRMQEEGIKPVEGFVAREVNFISLYALEDMEVCYRTRVTLGEDGLGTWTVPNGKPIVVTTAPQLAKRYGLSGTSIRNRLANNVVAPLEGVTDQDLTVVYPFELVRVLFEPVKLDVNGRGIVRIDDVDIAVISMDGIAKALGISFGGASARIKRGDIRPIPNVYSKIGVKDIKLFRVSDFPDLNLSLGDK